MTKCAAVRIALAGLSLCLLAACSPAQQQAPQSYPHHFNGSGAGPYDSPDFVVPESQIQG